MDTAASGSTGVGQQTPEDSNSPFTVRDFHIRQLMATLDTMKLVKVTAVTGTGAGSRAGTVDVQLLVNSIDGAGNATKQGIVYGIPWMRIQGGRNALVCDPQVGDIGYVICSDRDISSVKAAVTGGKNPITNPGSNRKYSISDGVYVGSILGAIPERYIAITDTGIKIADNHGNVVEMSSSGIKLTATTVTVEGDLNVTGDVKALSGGGTFVTLVHHQHTGNNLPPTTGH